MESAELITITDNHKAKESTELIVTNSRKAELARISYDNGYRDFALVAGLATNHSGSMEVVDYHTRAERFQEVIKAVQTIGAPPPTIRSRVGSFPFFKLPLYIHNWIYRLLLGPVYQYNRSGKNSHICPHVGEPQESYNDLYDHYYDYFVASVKADRDIGRAMADLSDDPIEPIPTVQEYEKQKAERKYALHPSRKTLYQLQLFPERRHCRQFQAYTNQLYLEWLRKCISNTSNLLKRTRRGILVQGRNPRRRFLHRSR
ncbi:hypothetical protein BDZ45DRAFT_724293 [Acephala macrosclerotiorum]|nr:hypothetical protein BDZ45DRAFT_724293 [Acephala macrosclerotiorum]